MMSDLISRQAAIDEIQMLLEQSEDDEHDKTWNNAIIGAVNAVKHHTKSAQPEPQWIPCSERLPEDYEDVLVWFEYFRYGSYNRLYQTHGIGDYSSEFDSWIINHQTGWHKLRVLAWMPLPEPYKMDGKEKDDE